ncbi:flagella basal body P-ring formation protein FlgA [Sphingomonas sp. TZW2008]|uniref:flagella basal body P-ring formation protein FlgA n=1 Tax=Sphingomonas sp. TZW2008 TaxID=1917973 RepID=UPI0027D83BBF|nr:flagella basal body P-ring formation protein FlgA [Sphingomonas sp. TZW2008]
MIALLLALGAAAFQDTAALDRAVAAFTGKPIGSEGGARAVVDPRLRLAQCPTVALSWRTDAHDAVVVSCGGPDWRIFVPVAMPPRAAVIARAAAAPLPAAAAEKVIRRGDPLVIEAGSPGFAITREGVAMADAAAGQRLMVRVDGGKMPVQAVALSPGRATLPGWGE